MTFHMPKLGRVAALGATALSAWACSEQASVTAPPRPLTPTETPAGFNVVPVTQANAVLCAQGPAGTYNFTVALNIPAGYVVNGVPGNYSATDLATVATAAYETVTLGSVSVASGACTTIGTVLQSLNFVNPVDPTITQDPLRFFTITETSGPTGTVLSSIVTTEQGQSDVTTAAPPNFATIDINFFHGAVADFVNVAAALGNQGCTPGYWKQSQHFDSWTATGLAPTDLISTVFTVPASYTVNGSAMGGFSLVQGLSFKGGNDVNGKAQTLLRAAIAAVLNASNSSIQYGMSKTAIVNAVNAALAGGNATTIINLAGQLDGLNNGLGGCPLN